MRIWERIAVRVGTRLVIWVIGTVVSLCCMGGILLLVLASFARSGLR